MSAPSFRLGATSYVYRGDLVHNARLLSDKVKDVELILFETEKGETNFPNALTLRALADIAQQHELSYTVHLPLDLHPAQPHTLTQAKRVIDLTAQLVPYAYVFHLDGRDIARNSWAEQGIRAVETLLSHVASPQQLALENLESYEPQRLEPVFAALPIARTLDIGHLWKGGHDLQTTLEAWLPSARVVHLHGVRWQDGRATDHLSLRVTPSADLDSVIDSLHDWGGVLTLEVFEDDFFSSNIALMTALKRRYTLRS